MTLRCATLQTEAQRRIVAGLANAALVKGGTSVNGVLGDDYLDAQGMINRAPVFRALESDLTGIASGDAVTVGGASYTVRAKEPDGQGMTMLILEAA